MKIEIEIDETRVYNWGALIIGEFIQNRITGEVTGVDKILAPGFMGDNSGEKPLIYAKVVKCRKKKSSQH